MTAYVDASALVKLLVVEPESAAVRTFLDGHDVIASSRVGLVEVGRAAARRTPSSTAPLTEVLESLLVVELDERIGVTAVGLQPTSLRALDAIHLASALELGDDLDAFVAYDARLLDAARELGLPVVSPE